MWQTIRQLNNFPQIAPPDTLFHIATASLTLNRIVKEQLRKTEEILIFRLQTFYYLLTFIRSWIFQDRCVTSFY